MSLEIVSRYPTTKRRTHDLLFIHGIFSCAGIWEPFFLPYFADNGYASHAVSLRGHGGSAGGGSLHTARLRDYVEDVEAAIAQLDQPTILVGASMGGVLVQHYLSRRPAPGAILLASAPPHGMMMSSLWMMASNPMLTFDLTLLSLMGPRMSSVTVARRALFRPDTPDDYIEQFLPYAQSESPLALLDMLGMDLPPTNQERHTPVLVLGAEKDAFLPPAAVEQTAHAFGVEAEIFPNMAHGMMLDPDWQQVAERMLAWLNGLADSS